MRVFFYVRSKDGFDKRLLDIGSFGKFVERNVLPAYILFLFFDVMTLHNVGQYLCIQFHLIGTGIPSKHQTSIISCTRTFGSQVPVLYKYQAIQVF